MKYFKYSLTEVITLNWAQIFTLFSAILIQKVITLK